MAADEGFWGDLFAQAADISTTTTSSTQDDNDGLRTRSSHGEKRSRRKNRKRKRLQQDEDDNDTAFTNMLKTRIDPPNHIWPFWFKLGRPLHSMKQQPSSCDQWDFSEVGCYSKCANCKQSALHHHLILVENNKDTSWSNHPSVWTMRSFASLRNIRCCAKFLAQSEGGTPKSLMETIRKENKILRSMIPIIGSQLPPDESSLLEGKLGDVFRMAALLTKTQQGKEQPNKKKKRCPHNFDEAVRVIIACDAAYYRIYYLQLTRMMPVLMIENTEGVTEGVFLPHPSDYFGLAYFTMDLPNAASVHSKVLEELKEKDVFDSLPTDLKGILSYCSTRISSSEGEHALSAIYRCRWLESMSLFYETGWSSSSQAKNQAVSSLCKPYDEDSTSIDRHETPAPPVLCEWRDSCRDFMCNLYAYATLDPNTVTKLCNLLLKQPNISKVIEIGAGTGYIAKLISNIGISVDAWDVNPTAKKNEAMNEYHGRTPPFYHVGKSSTFPIMNAKESALLLCYPPPESSMAHDTLKQYLHAGGNCLVHIGEFKGLTGDNKFEHLLLQKLICQERIPCLTWGTDVSHITVWFRKKTTSPPVLLPCSNCNSREATRVCRFSRSLVYCSHSCFDKDSAARTSSLQLRMINIDNGILDFSNSKHFAPL